jgi:hypothetical protein
VRSADGGQTWQSVPTGIGVGLTASALDERGRMVIVSQAGHVLVSGDNGASFAPMKLERPIPAAAVVSGGAGALVIAGPRGVQTLPWPEGRLPCTPPAPPSARNARAVRPRERLDARALGVQPPQGGDADLRHRHGAARDRRGDAGSRSARASRR